MFITPHNTHVKDKTEQHILTKNDKFIILSFLRALRLVGLSWGSRHRKGHWGIPMNMLCSFHSNLPIRIDIDNFCVGHEWKCIRMVVPDKRSRGHKIIHSLEITSIHEFHRNLSRVCWESHSGWLTDYLTNHPKNVAIIRYCVVYVL